MCFPDYDSPRLSVIQIEQENGQISGGNSADPLGLPESGRLYFTESIPGFIPKLRDGVIIEIGGNFNRADLRLPFNFLFLPANVAGILGIDFNLPDRRRR